MRDLVPVLARQPANASTRQLASRSRVYATPPYIANQRRGREISRPRRRQPYCTLGCPRRGAAQLGLGQLVQVDPGQIRHELVQLAECLRRVGQVQPLVELLRREPPRGKVLAQQGRGAVAVRVGRADLRIARHPQPPGVLWVYRTQETQPRGARYGAASASWRPTGYGAG